MKYYSEELKRIFNTPEELEQAESKIKNRTVAVEEIKVKINDTMKSLMTNLKSLGELVDKAEDVCTEEELDEIGGDVISTLFRSMSELYNIF